MENATAEFKAESTVPIVQLRFEQVGLKASLGSRYLLKAITFSIMQGDRLAIVGPSGAGKTSLLRLMNRLVDPDEGQIIYGDRPLSAYPVLQVRQSIPFVLQEPRLLGMTVEQTLTYPLQLRQLPADEIRDRLQDWTDRLHIPVDWLARTETQLSLGQRQLVGIARALMIQPQMLLLDEPTAALDVGRRSQLVDVLQTYCENNGCTIVMISHDLPTAQDFCSKLLYLVQGQVVQHTAYGDVDWLALHDAIVQAEQQQAADWDDDEG
ncbi:MAG: ATP-binding cassette domain-containing protein [Cyanothece sp. SIO2G6]|nr:ATP-binding cassette domain-containing protein [Cyanothece sp. SIO2G6]